MAPLNPLRVLTTAASFLLVSGHVQQETFRLPRIDLPHEIIRSWAQYTPAFPLQSYQIPESCSITQVNILQRHGARFPTTGATKRILAAISKLDNVLTFNDAKMAGLKNWTYELGSNDLIPFGEMQAFESGFEAFRRYSSLVSEEILPFVRASDGKRVVVSAENWINGFAEASGGIVNPAPPLLISESGNNTLDDKMCPNAGDPDSKTAVWQETFAPRIAQRLNAGAPGAKFTNADIPNLISLCAFDTLYKQEPSPWCYIFDKQDFEESEYFYDLDKYYGTGYGQPLGPVQGVGYINELLARLTGQPVSDETQTNRTLDSSPDTFPLHRTLYADFSHDNEMIAIYAAMGILKPSSPLELTDPDPDRTWLVSHLVPFASSLVTERLLCGGVQSIRILLNDGVVPLSICGAGSDGICTLKEFVKSQSYARNNGEGDWEKCFV
ncbi:hypothetical protein M422DRAFT_779118 [Sphaerobolus stellatus SS14]|uniref:Phytase A n=1 Tax=Sphaerobolus stellatus (strain SS14) TaxID=990650 RepID=A0A0C9VDS6_SPHS4|nr:hypothetical protein M422DRAFT_779118 [Sphaerobolus stellatus SS14]